MHLGTDPTKTFLHNPSFDVQLQNKAHVKIFDLEGQMFSFVIDTSIVFLMLPFHFFLDDSYIYEW